MGAIGKRESENDVVWITLQARHFRWKKVKIPKLKGDRTDAMSILYDNPNHREIVFKIDTVQEIGKTTTSVTIVAMLPSIFGPIFYGEEKRHVSCTYL